MKTINKQNKTIYDCLSPLTKYFIQRAKQDNILDDGVEGDDEKRGTGIIQG